MKSPRTIVWDEAASDSLESAVKFIRQDSPQNADRVQAKILDAISDLIQNPERHTFDKYSRNTKRLYRAFELYKLRVSYSVLETEIRIVRIRSTHQKPLKY